MCRARIVAWRSLRDMVSIGSRVILNPRVLRIERTLNHYRLVSARVNVSLLGSAADSEFPFLRIAPTERRGLPSRLYVSCVSIGSAASAEFPFPGMLQKLPCQAREFSHQHIDISTYKHGGYMTWQ